MSNPTATAQPILSSGLINGHDALTYDGVDDDSSNGVVSYGSTQSKGQFIIAFRTPNDLTAFQPLWNTNRDASFHYRLAIAINGGKLWLSWNNSATNQTITGNTTLSINTNYVISIESNGSAYFMKINGINETFTGVNNGNWLDTIGGLNNIVAIGNLHYAGHVSQCSFSEVGNFPYVDAAQAKEISDGYVKKYGV